MREILETLWEILWFPYGLAFSHRTYLSHVPPWGTLCRVAYLAAPLIVLAWICDADLTLIPAAIWQIAGGFIWGLFASDVAHLVMDSVPRRRKRK